MNQLDAYERFIRNNEGQLTLGEILRTEFAAEYRKLNTFLRRRRGWTVVCSRNASAEGQNLYTFVEPALDGQRRFA